MALSNENISLIRGDDTSRVVWLKVRQTEGETPFDLSKVARIDLHANSGRNRVLSLSTEDDSITITEALQGKLLLTFEHTLTQEANWLEALYDLQLTFTSGRIQTVLKGKIKLEHDITQLGI